MGARRVFAKSLQGWQAHLHGPCRSVPQVNMHVCEVRRWWGLHAVRGKRGDALPEGSHSRDGCVLPACGGFSGTGECQPQVQVDSQVQVNAWK